MAVDRNPNHSAHEVRPARAHAPAGTENTSKAASGGQEAYCGDVAATPSMSSDSSMRHNPAQPRPDRAPGGAVSD